MSIADRLIERLRSETLTAWLGMATALIVVGTFVLAIIYVPSILNSTSAVEQGTNLTGCRSSFNAVVTDKRTEFDVARSHRDTSAALVNLTLLELAQAALFGDDGRVNELEAELPALREDVRDANATVAIADQALIDANAAYQDAIEMSRENPDRFLAECERTSQ